MWSIDTRWFDVALIMSIFAVGNVLFGRFEEHKSRSRRLLKVAIILGVALAVAEIWGRSVEFAVLAILLIGAGYVHAWWLPKHGVNGWTGEPRDKYLALVISLRARIRATSPKPDALDRNLELTRTQHRSVAPSVGAR